MTPKTSVEKAAAEAVIQTPCVQSLADLTPIFRSAFTALGFQNFGLANLHAPRSHRSIEFIHGQFDLGLIAHGRERGFPERGAGLELALSSGEPVFWSDLDYDGLSPAERAVLDECALWNVHEAFFLHIPRDGSPGRVVLAASSQSHLNQPDIRQAMTTLATLYEAAVHRLSSPNPMPAAPQLSARQLECLRWAREGKSAHDIAEILGLSKRTVEEHFSEACRRLGVRSRIQAVAQAVIMNMIRD